MVHVTTQEACQGYGMKAVTEINVMRKIRKEIISLLRTLLLFNR